MNKKRIQPLNMSSSPAFSQAIENSSASTILFIGGQMLLTEMENSLDRLIFRSKAKRH
jgi:hypothetical protein